MTTYEEMKFRKFTKKSEIQKALNTLKGIIQGICIDGNQNHIELDELDAWCLNNNFLSEKKPFTELIPLISDSISDNLLTQNEIDDINWVCDKFLSTNNYYDDVTISLQVLQGIFHGILSDNKISDLEVLNLRDWINDNEHLAGFYPYDEIGTLLTTILSDKIITDDEFNILKVFFSDFIDKSIDTNIDMDHIEQLKEDYTVVGICATCPEIEFEDKLFCFTGASTKTTREGFNNIVTSLKGEFRNSISSKTDYLVIGNGGNPCWAYSCYGRKVEQALNLRKKGCKIIIIHENDFLDALRDLGK
ncbi:BRCT domain-containing protein [Clostridium gasigenes]|uniref:BRCT domain-containing protein n=1 Tax=Clostridium gasigenes TaxID=94869 RepID=UPI001623211C|nr:BRCT domain-containing protein [Clostridium gasigenes]MBB6622542.1 BRCT domain-containing protein [Clostridium gasigenes]